MLRIRQTWRSFFAGRGLVQAPVLLTTTSTPTWTPISTQPTQTIFSLPAEVLDQIFEHFEEDFDLLTVCTLVCPLWRTLCQPKLWHRLVLSTQDIHHSTQFRKFMLDAPHIRAAVQHVEVHFLESWDSNVADNLLADILELLPRPESLKLYGPRISERIKWTRLSQHLRNSIKTVLRRQSLRAFLIDGWVMDMNMSELNGFFAGCRALTQLSLLEVSDGLWGSTDNVHMPPGTPRLVLDELTISNTFAKDPKLIEWLCKPESTIDLTQMKTLHVIESRDDEAISSLLATAGRSLQTLELNISFSADNAIALAHSNNIRALTFTFGVFYTELYNSSIPLICATLDTLPHPDNNLEEVTISLYITHPRNTNVRIFPPPPLSRFNYERWTTLGGVLSGLKYSSLARITFELVHHGIDIDAYIAIARQRLGDLNAEVVWKYSREDPPNARAKVVVPASATDP